jgi:hypothetical protein
LHLAVTVEKPRVDRAQKRNDASPNRRAEAAFAHQQLDKELEAERRHWESKIPRTWWR